MKLFGLVLMFLFFAVSANAQTENSLRPVPSQPRANFFLDVLNFKSDSVGFSRVDVFMQVPYTEIQFIKTGAGFAAGYTITISVYNEEKEKLLTEKLWSEKITADNFEQTILTTLMALSFSYVTAN